MTPRRAETMLGMISLSLVVTQLLVACGGSQPRTDSAKAGSDSASSGARAANAVGTAKTPPTKPPKKLKTKHEKMQAQDFKDAVADVDFADPKDTGPDGASHMTTHRNCVGDPAGSESTECLLLIVPAVGAVLVVPEDLGDNGRILAYIENTGDKDEATLGVPHKKRVYLVAREEDSKQYLYVVDPENPGASGGYRSEFKRCKHTVEMPPNDISRARLNTCKGIEAAAGLAVTKADTVSIRRTMHLSGPWVTCAQGCCYGEGGTETKSRTARGAN
jgi:hypothetical protein